MAPAADTKPREATEEERQEAQRLQEEADRAAAELEQKGILTGQPEAKGKKSGKKSGTKPYRSFVAPIERNTSFLVKAGEPVRVRDPNSPTGFRDASREGDVIARFVNGTLVTSNEEIIEWCDAHPEICRDAEDPQAAVWFNLKTAQTPTSRRDSTLPPGIDVDAALRGEMQEFNKDPEGDTVRRARDFARQANDRR